MQLSIIYEYGNIANAEELAAQLTNDAELIILTPKETKQLKALISDSNKPISIIKHTSKTDIAEYRKKAVEQARGSYIAFIMSTDTVTPDYVEKLLKAISKGGEYIPIFWEFSNWHNFVFEGSNNLWSIFANCISKELAIGLDYRLTKEAVEKNKVRLDTSLRGQSTQGRIYYHRSK